MGSADEEQAAFRRLYDEHVEAIYRYVAYRRQADKEDVADVVADVFAVAWRRRHDRPEPATRSWLYGVARRVLADHRRTDARRRRLEAKLSRAVDTRTTTSDEATAMTDERLDAAIARLRPADREVLRLIAWDDLSREEAASTLGCSVNAVNIRLHRAIKRLGRDFGLSVGDLTKSQTLSSQPDIVLPPTTRTEEEGRGPSWTSTR